MIFASICFGSHRNHPQGAVQYLAKNYKYDSTVLVGMDVVNVMAACENVCLCAMCTDHGAGRYCLHRTVEPYLWFLAKYWPAP
jgi:hypothetical protein